MRKTVSLLLFLVCASLCWGQQNSCHPISGNQTMCTNYAQTTIYTIGDNLPNAKTVNVWHAMVGAPASLVEMTSGIDSNGNVKHFGLTSGGAVWEYLDYWASSNPNTWLSHPEYGTVAQISYDGSGNIYALGTGTCSGAHPFWYWNGSSFQVPGHGACLTQFSPALDGQQIAGVDANGNWLVSWNGGQTWSNEGGAYLSATSLSAATSSYLLVKSDHSVVLWQAGTVTQLAGVSAISVVGDDSAMSRTYALGTNGYVYHYNGSGWDKLAGSGFSNLNTCGLTCTFAIDASGNAYRLPDVSLTAAATLTGNTTCNPSPCPTSTHTPSVTTKFTKHSLTGGQTTVGPSRSPETPVNVSAQDTSIDLFDCFDDWSACFTTPSDGQIECSIVGTIFSSPIIPNNLTVQIARTRTDNGQSVSCFTGYSFQCGSAPGCTYEAPWTFRCDSGMNPTPPPDYQFTVDSACHTNGQTPPEPDPSLWGFDTSGPCIYQGPIGNSAPLFCVHDPLPGALGNGPITKWPLFDPIVPKNTPGKCTQYGITH